ncbi:MAG TPA: response regulator, partial [Chloroflexota bacterium]|nr:response regulator [Chloroflexota bacterium]
LRVRLDGVVRQAAEATGKLVRWQLQGGSVAVEKNVFDRLFEPLMHLLRNAVDHGLETQAERCKVGKPEAGAITVTAAQEGNHIVITVADDGRGIVANKVAALAVERGLITTEQAAAMTHQQKVGLIFTPGFSTAARVSHISGRGVGMDAVREACLRMAGTLDVSSWPGAGTTVTMRLPLSLSVTRGLIIRDGGCLMVLPVAQVVALHLVAATDVVEVPGGRVARIEGQELPIYNLPPLAGAVPAGYIQNGEINVLQVAHADGSIGVVIEDVLGEEEILIKASPALLRGVTTLLGAYVLPDGRVAPVVNVPQMLADLRPVATLTAPKDERKSGELRALVVDDSMSMRVALSGTLQNAGFTVLTARDGQEALEVLKREGLPSLVMLDVEMPRMDGLETLFAIRQMASAAELPVFMMTSRGGAKHRRAAEQLGATRYFTKPYRDSELATAARAACTDAHAP